ncbi:YbjN domain-containing protein [Actinomyces mediterranea]|uniref:YbjN domain-containing protein n=1 Tax=Actinomyces mediterranea TaxID=1871028 RepID=UPI00097135C2|nr:YbjN domain-containing protein [Actinomyces mediterranea]
MGWFNKKQPSEPSPVALDEVRPISTERMALLFDTEGWHWRIDDDGDLGGMWDGSMFYFRLTGKDKEVLNIVSFMKGTYPRELRSDLLNHIEDWHRTKLWPKGYFREVPGDRLQVMAEVNVDYEHGATDAQLMQNFRCALGTTLQFFTSITEQFGAAEEAEKPEGE